MKRWIIRYSEACKTRQSSSALWAHRYLRIVTPVDAGAASSQEQREWNQGFTPIPSYSRKTKEIKSFIFLFFLPIPSFHPFLPSFDRTVFRFPCLTGCPPFLSLNNWTATVLGTVLFHIVDHREEAVLPKEQEVGVRAIDWCTPEAQWSTTPWDITKQRHSGNM